MTPQREAELRSDLAEIQSALDNFDLPGGPTEEECKQLEILAADIRRWLSQEDKKLSEEFKQTMRDGAAGWNKR